MARSKSSISTFLATFKRQAYQSWYIDGFSLVQFTKLMNILFEELYKIACAKFSASERQWRSCKSVWDNAWNIKGGRICQHIPLELENLHVWFCKTPSGATMWKPFGKSPHAYNQRATLRPGFLTLPEIIYSEEHPMQVDRIWHFTDSDDDCAKENKTQSCYPTFAQFETSQHPFEACTSGEPILNAHVSAQLPYCQPTETGSPMEGLLGEYFPCSQFNDMSPIATRWRASQTPSPPHKFAPCYEMPLPKETMSSQDGLHDCHIDYPSYIADSSQWVPTSNQIEISTWLTEDPTTVDQPTSTLQIA